MEERIEVTIDGSAPLSFGACPLSGGLQEAKQASNEALSRLVEARAEEDRGAEELEEEDRDEDVPLAGDALEGMLAAVKPRKKKSRASASSAGGASAQLGSAAIASSTARTCGKVGRASIAASQQACISSDHSTGQS